MTTGLICHYRSTDHNCQNYDVSLIKMQYVSQIYLHIRQMNVDVIRFVLKCERLFHTISEVSLASCRLP